MANYEKNKTKTLKTIQNMNKIYNIISMSFL